MEKKTIEVRNGKVYGTEVSEYGLDNKQLDYYALGKIVGDMIANNIIRDVTMDDWELVNGEWEGQAVHTDYIIDYAGYKFLSEFTDELVFYNEQLDLYIWAVTHYGTSWDYVLTGISLIEQGVELE